MISPTHPVRYTPLQIPTLDTFILLDTSGSMAGRNIQAVNDFLLQFPEELARLEVNLGIRIVMHVLCFDSTVRWLTPIEGVEASAFRLDKELVASGLTDTAEALRCLMPCLTHRAQEGHKRPVLVMLTDGYSNDRTETCKSIQDLVRLSPFSIRLAIGANNFEPRELEDFASEASLEIHDASDCVVEKSSPRKLIFTTNDSWSMVDALWQLTRGSVIASNNSAWPFAPDDATADYCAPDVPTIAIHQKDDEQKDTSPWTEP